MIEALYIAIFRRQIWQQNNRFKEFISAEEVSDIDSALECFEGNDDLLGILELDIADESRMTVRQFLQDIDGLRRERDADIRADEAHRRAYSTPSI